jgi:hypothetical protein
VFPAAAIPRLRAAVAGDPFKPPDFSRNSSHKWRGVGFSPLHREGFG